MTARRNIPLKELKAIGRVGRQQVGRNLTAFQYTTLVHRPVSVYFTKLFLMAGIAPDTVTMVSYLFAVAAGVLFIFGNYWYALIGIALYQLFIVLDCSDGDMSRLLYGVKKNPRGGFLEYWGHNIIQPFIIVCIAFGVYNNPQSLLVVALFHQNLVILVIGFVGSSLYLALHVLDGLSEPADSNATSGDPPTPPVNQRGLFRYPLVILASVRTLAQKYNFADPLLLITAVSNTLWLYLIIWGIIHISLVSVNSVTSYRRLPKPQVLEQETEPEKQGSI